MKAVRRNYLVESPRARSVYAVTKTGSAALDKPRGRADDERMSSSPDKDYIDAKSQAVSASVSGEIKAFRAEVNARFAEVNARFAVVNGSFAEVNGRFAEVNGSFAEVNGRFAEVNARIDHLALRIDSLERTMQLELKLIREELNARFAQMEVAFQRAHNETLKWTMGAVLAGLTLSLSVPTFMLRHIAENAGAAAPAPAVIAPQTTPPAAPAKPAPPSAPH